MSAASYLQIVKKLRVKTNKLIHHLKLKTIIITYIRQNHRKHISPSWRQKTYQDLYILAYFSFKFMLPAFSDRILIPLCKKIWPFFFSKMGFCVSKMFATLVWNNYDGIIFGTRHLCWPKTSSAFDGIALYSSRRKVKACYLNILVFSQSTSNWNSHIGTLVLTSRTIHLADPPIRSRDETSWRNNAHVIVSSHTQI